MDTCIIYRRNIVLILILYNIFMYILKVGSFSDNQSD